MVQQRVWHWGLYPLCSPTTERLLYRKTSILSSSRPRIPQLLLLSRGRVPLYRQYPSRRNVPQHPPQPKAPYRPLSWHPPHPQTFHPLSYLWPRNPPDLRCLTSWSIIRTSSASDQKWPKWRDANPNATVSFSTNIYFLLSFNVLIN